MSAPYPAFESCQHCKDPERCWSQKYCQWDEDTSAYVNASMKAEQLAGWRKGIYRGPYRPGDSMPDGRNMAALERERHDSTLRTDQADRERLDEALRAVADPVDFGIMLEQANVDELAAVSRACANLNANLVLALDEWGQVKGQNRLNPSDHPAIEGVFKTLAALERACLQVALSD